MTGSPSYLAVPLSGPTNDSSPNAPDRIMIQAPTNINANPGSLQVNPFPMRSGTEFTVTMSDDTGFGSGGTSIIQSVKGGDSTSCFHTPEQEFSFDVKPKTNWTTCQTIKLSTNKTDPYPYTYYALSPQTTPYKIKRSTDNNEVVSWQLPYDEGRAVTIIALLDRANIQFNSGGHITNYIKQGNDVSCVKSPIPSPVDSAVPQSSTSDSSSDNASGGGLGQGASAGVGVGATLGGLAVIAAIAAFFVLQRRKQKEGVQALNASSARSQISDHDVVDMENTQVITPYMQQTTGSVDGESNAQRGNQYPPTIHTAQSSPPLYSKQHSKSPGLIYIIQNHDGTETVTDVPPSYENSERASKTS